MVPRKPLAYRQTSAQSGHAGGKVFASARTMRETEGRAMDCIAVAPVCQDCDPSLPLRPVLTKDGPSFCPGGLAVFRQCGFSAFSLLMVAVRMGLRLVPIRQGLARLSTNKRGSLTCSNLSPRLRFSWSLLLATARSIRIAPEWAPWAALPSGPPRATIWPRAPLSVACLARLPAIRACAADLTMPRPGRGAAPQGKAIRGRPRVALSFQGPAEGRLGGIA